MTYYAIRSLTGRSFQRAGTAFRPDAWTLVNGPDSAVLAETKLSCLAVVDLSEIGLGGLPITNPSLLSGDPNDALALSELDARAVEVSRPNGLRAARQQLLAQVNDSATEKQMKTAKVALGHADTGGGVLSWLNPETGAIIIDDIVFDVTVVASGACSLDVGTTVASATTVSDNLIDGLDVHTATGAFARADQAGANGKAKQHLAAGGWVTASKDSGAAAALAGFAYISYYTA